MYRILLISGFRIFPSNTGGHVHTSGIARSLARMGHRVRLYSLAGRHGDYPPAALLGRSYRVDSVEDNLVEETNLGLTFGVLQTLARRLGYPRVWQYAMLRRGLVPRRLRRALHEAEMIFSDMPWCPPIPGPWSTKPWFLVSHNLEHLLLEQATGRPRRFADWMRAIECAAPSHYRDIFPCAEADRDFFRAHDLGGGLKLPMIRCGVDPDSYVVPAGTRERVRALLGLDDAARLLIFSGSSFAPNLQALAELREFCRLESDFLARARVHVLALGSMVAAPFRDAALIATGRVPEVAPYFAAGDAGLNPVTSGSGANVKLFEYLATRLPVISTPFGVRGTPLQPHVDYVPYAPGALKDAIEHFLRARSPLEWREHAEVVWARHRRSCNIEDLVRDALAQVPEFQRP